MFSLLIDLFFPKACFSCTTYLKDNESYVCTTCRHKLPITNFHNTNDTTVASVFYGRSKIKNATALLRFEKKGITQKLMHQLKYKGQEEIGVFLGEWLGEELASNPNFNDVDIVIPVPLHKKKLRQRGYNQVEKFGREIASALKVDYVDTVLLKETNTTSQVTKQRLARWNNSNALFKVRNKEEIAEKHILIVDDIITTGATLEACIQELSGARNVKISIATMAIA